MGESFLRMPGSHSIPRQNQQVAMMILLVGLPEAAFRLVCIPVDRRTQLERITRRWTELPHEKV
jgi:hypothetical protein